MSIVTVTKMRPNGLSEEFQALVILFNAVWQAPLNAKSCSDIAAPRLVRIHR
jgi:hypothetical protein